MITINVIQGDVNCYGGSDGFLDITFTGGTPPYDWSITGSNGYTNNGTGDVYISGLEAGSYEINVTDANSDTGNTTVNIAQNSEIVIAFNGTQPLCNGGSNGSIDASVSGGGGGFYTYLWSNGAVNISSIVGLEAGTYTLWVTDGFGCVASASYTLTEPDVLTVSMSSTPVLCNGGSTATATVNASGGTPPYSYLWSNGETSDTISGIPAGTYTVTVTDANGCWIIRSVTITQPPALTLTYTKTNTTPSGGSGGIRIGRSTPSSIRVGNLLANEVWIGNTKVWPTGGGSGNDGSIDITVNGGTPGYTYLWNDGVTTEDRINLSPGTYSCIITDSNLCAITTGPITIG